MKNPKNQQGKYAYLEQLTTEELDELLRLEFNADEEDADPELVLAIMEVIAKREPEDIPPTDPEETWKTFQARNLTKPSEQTTEDTHTKQEETIVEYQPSHRRKRWFASVVAAACAVFVFCAPVAHGSTVLETMVNWKQSTFSLPGNQESGTSAVLKNPDYLKVVDAVKEQVENPLLPNWYPDGTTVDFVEDCSVDGSLDYCVSFFKDTESFSFFITTYSENDSAKNIYEKDAGSGAVKYMANGTPYYVMKNLERNVVIWQGDKEEYCLSGYLTDQEIERMMESISTGGNET